MKGLPFIGRESELKILNDLTKKKVSSLVVMRGRRRVGKSRLIKEFAKEYRFLTFSGLVPTEDTTVQSQINEFTRQLISQLKISEIKFEDWGDLFSFLARETATGRVVILFDEISWMGSKDSDFLGKLKNAWDLLFKDNHKLILILCSSVSSWIDENILKNTGFVGRLSLVIDLEELTIQECSKMLQAIGFRGSNYDMFRLLSITGGVPRYLEEIKPDRPADENIKNLCFQKEGILFREFKDIFVDIFTRRSAAYKKIVEVLVSGPKEFSEIAAAIDMQKGGHVSDYMLDLTKSGFVKRDFTWNIKGAKESKLSHYRLSDNYLRFYLKYIEKNQGKIEADHFRDKSLSTLPGIDTIMGLQFENLVLNNRNFILKKLNIHLEDVVISNPYFQRAQVRKKGCQIDYLIQLRTNVLYACEVKFSRQEIKPEIIDEVREKIQKFYLPRGFSIMPILIHVNGVSDEVTDREYFSHIVDFGDFLNPR